MTPSDSEKQQWAKARGLSSDEFEARIASLSQRLKIPRPETLPWTELFLRLMDRQPEFKKPKRGRPPLRGPNKDYKRQKAVENLRREKQRQAGGVAPKITDKALIKELCDSGHPLFRNIVNPSQSVSNGKRISKEDRREAARLREEYWKRDAERRAGDRIELLKEIRSLQKPVGLGLSWKALVRLRSQRKLPKNSD